MTKNFAALGRFGELILITAVVLAAVLMLSPQKAFAAITVTSIHIASDNASTTLATSTNNVGISFTASAAISISAATSTIRITGTGSTLASTTIVLVDAGSHRYAATTTLGSATNPADGNISFLLSIADNTGNSTTTKTQADITDGSQVRLDTVAPTITPITIASNSSKGATHAKSGDTVTVSFTASNMATFDGLQAPTVDIGTHTGITAVTSDANLTWTASAVITSSDTEGTVSFTIHTPTDFAGNATTSATWLTSGSGVTFDKTGPTVTVTGSNPVSTTQNATYSDAGATASDTHDGDLTSSIVTTNGVNTASLGSYTMTYTVTDSAGNSGSATRTVNVVGGAIGIVGCIGVVNTPGSTACSGMPSGFTPSAVGAVPSAGSVTTTTTTGGTSQGGTAGVSGASTLKKHLQFGVKGSADVSLLQKLLAQDATIYPDGLVTGYFGQLTLKAVKAFQTKYNISSASDSAYGQVGPKTRAQLVTVFGN